jgi:riboflavin kinase/FMN adenylyltransferase
MQVFRRIPQQSSVSTVLTIGNFDGVHLGHRAMLDRLTACARAAGLPAAVLTFEPHPRELFAPEQAPARLSSLREKLNLLEKGGIDHVYICRFDRRMAAISAEEFIENLLVRGLSVRHLIIGDDFRFGKGRGGDFALLQQMGAAHRYTVEAMHTVDVDGERVSSSAVRDALAAGDLEHAARLLGRPYGIAGHVIHGDKVGRKIGFPTANIQLKRKKVPMTGVFAVTVSGLGDKDLPGAANLGVRPTLGDSLKPLLEVHLLDYDYDIYRSHLTVNFLHKLRDEAKYASLDALTTQIARDVAATRDYFKHSFKV